MKGKCLLSKILEDEAILWDTEVTLGNEALSKPSTKILADISRQEII